MQPLEINGRSYRAPDQPTVVVCIDGVDPRYVTDGLARGLLPRIAAMIAGGGEFAHAASQMPSFTNPNNLCIVTGVAAAEHGLSGNHALTDDGREVQLDDPAFLRAGTIHAAMHAAGVPVLVVTTKAKLRRLLSVGDVPCVSVEGAATETLGEITDLEQLVGRPAPGIYEWDASHFALELGLALAAVRAPRLMYVSLTDAVQHANAPGEPLSDRYLVRLDALIGAYLDAGWRIALVADHGMNDKPQIRYLADTLETAGIGGARVLLPITDPYVAHHAALGSAAWVYAPADQRARAADVLAQLPGVEAVLERARAAAELELPADRIGDLVVLADAGTALGGRERDHDLTRLHGPLRSHGGFHEASVPLLLSHPPGPQGRRIIDAGARTRDVHAIVLEPA
jgi:phosphonoacetate hydrolase